MMKMTNLTRLFFLILINIVFTSAPCWGQAVPQTYNDKWALVIKIDKFPEDPVALSPIPSALNDARKANAFFESQDFTHIIDLPVSKASSTELKKYFGEGLPRLIGENDLLVVFICTHGTSPTDDIEGEPYLVCSDTRMKNLWGSAVKFSDIKRCLKTVKAKRKILILDTCHSGGILSPPTSTNNFKEEKKRIEVKDDPNLTILSACQLEQKAKSTEDNQYGLFTFLLFENLNDGSSVYEAFDKTRDDVTKESRNEQIPYIENSEGTDSIYLNTKPSHPSTLDFYRMLVGEPKPPEPGIANKPKIQMEDDKTEKHKVAQFGILDFNLNNLSASESDSRSAKAFESAEKVLTRSIDNELSKKFSPQNTVTTRDKHLEPDPNTALTHLAQPSMFKIACRLLGCKYLIAGELAVNPGGGVESPTLTAVAVYSIASAETGKTIVYKPDKRMAKILGLAEDQPAGSMFTSQESQPYSDLVLYKNILPKIARNIAFHVCRVLQQKQQVEGTK